MTQLSYLKNNIDIGHEPLTKIQIWKKKKKNLSKKKKKFERKKKNYAIVWPIISLAEKPFVLKDHIN
jgi:hypothetical protein